MFNHNRNQKLVEPLVFLNGVPEDYINTTGQINQEYSDFSNQFTQAHVSEPVQPSILENIVGCVVDGVKDIVSKLRFDVSYSFPKTLSLGVSVKEEKD